MSDTDAIMGAVAPDTFALGVFAPDAVAAMGVEYNNGETFPLVVATFIGPAVGVAPAAMTRVMWAVPALAEFVAAVHVMIEQSDYAVTFRADLDRAIMEARQTVEDQRKERE